MGRPAGRGKGGVVADLESLGTLSGPLHFWGLEQPSVGPGDRPSAVSKDFEEFKWCNTHIQEKKRCRLEKGLVSGRCLLEAFQGALLAGDA